MLDPEMKRRSGLIAAVIAPVIVAGCGYPDFQIGNPGGGGAGASSSSSAASSSSASSSGASSASSSSSGASSSSSASSASSSSGASCPVDHLLISQIRSRGVGGADDEIVDLYNPTSAPVMVDSSWTLQARGTGALSYDVRWTGDGSVIPAYGHYLIAGSAYAQAPPPDGVLASGISDAGSILLAQDTANVDVVCYEYSLFTSGILSTLIDPYTCAGTPATNPHDDTSGTDVDISIERRPGGALGNCTDTMNNAYDFVQQMPADPADLASPPAP
jgi:hypothetical protein